MANRRRPPRRQPRPGHIGPGPDWQGTGPRPLGPNPSIPPPPGPASLPLSSVFESGRRGLEDSYAGSLAQIQAQRGQVQPMLDLNLARLGSNQTEDRNTTAANLGERGIYGNGVGGQVMHDVDIGYDRQRQDMALETARILDALAQQEGEAGLGYSQGITELLLQQAASQATEPSLAAPRRRRRQPRRVRGRN